MQRAACATGGWSHWTGRILPVLCFALLTTGAAQAADRNPQDDAGSAPRKTVLLQKTVLVGKDAASGKQEPPRKQAAAGKEEPPRREDPPQREDPPKPQDQPKPAAKSISLDRVIAQVEKRHQARVVRQDKGESAGRPVYKLRLLSDDGRVFAIVVDAETGQELK